MRREVDGRRKTEEEYCEARGGGKRIEREGGAT